MVIVSLKMIGSPLLQARKIKLSGSGGACEIFPSLNDESFPASSILNPLETKNDENCQSFSNLPLESIMSEMFSPG